jgi:hypothetical protein
MFYEIFTFHIRGAQKFKCAAPLPNCCSNHDEIVGLKLLLCGGRTTVYFVALIPDYGYFEVLHFQAK